MLKPVSVMWNLSTSNTSSNAYRSVRPLPDLPRRTRKQREQSRIRVAYRRTRGVDPTKHLWYEAGDTVRRVCDDGNWQGHWQDSEYAGAVVHCHMCKSVSLADARGPFLFRRHSELPGFYGLDPTVWAFFSYNGPMLKFRDPSIPKPRWEVSMPNFADFCDVKPGKRYEVVMKQLGMKEKSGSSEGYFNPYVYFRNVVSDVHIPTQDLGLVSNAFDALLAHPGVQKAKSKRHVELLCGAYLRYFRTRQDVRRLFSPDTGLVRIGELGVNVNPEVRIQTAYKDNVEWVLRMWLRQTDVPDVVRQTMSYMIQKVREDWDWPPDWRFGIFDVLNGAIAEEVEVDDEMAELVTDRAEEYVSIRRRLGP